MAVRLKEPHHRQPKLSSSPPHAVKTQRCTTAQQRISVANSLFLESRPVNTNFSPGKTPRTARFRILPFLRNTKHRDNLLRSPRIPRSKPPSRPFRLEI